SASPSPGCRPPRSSGGPRSASASGGFSNKQLRTSTRVSCASRSARRFGWSGRQMPTGPSKRGRSWARRSSRSTEGDRRSHGQAPAGARGEVLAEPRGGPREQLTANPTRDAGIFEHQSGAVVHQLAAEVERRRRVPVALTAGVVVDAQIVLLESLR